MAEVCLCRDDGGGPQLSVYPDRALSQRGTNENTNGLGRQYLPKGTDLSGYMKRELNAMAPR